MLFTLKQVTDYLTFNPRRASADLVRKCVFCVSVTMFSATTRHNPAKKQYQWNQRYTILIVKWQFS